MPRPVRLKRANPTLPTPWVAQPPSMSTATDRAGGPKLLRGGQRRAFPPASPANHRGRAVHPT